ncbi:MAG: two-component system NtrC family sensor kinase [Kiritimatiellia bacterium]|jgi:two-component system NtrC family sensor kinase
MRQSMLIRVLHIPFVYKKIVCFILPCFFFFGFFSAASLSVDSPADPSAGDDAWVGKARTVVVGGDYNFPPYEFLDADRQPTGYNVEITKTIAEIMGIKVNIVLGGWDDMREAFNRGEIDVLQGMTVTEERQKTITFSPPNVMVQQSIFARTGTAEVTSLKDLRGKDIIVQRQGSMHDYLLQNKFDVEIIAVTTHVDVLRLLSSGKHDYAIGANLPGLYLGKELGLSNLTVVGKPFIARGYTYAVLKGNEALLAQFSEGLAILKNTGRQQQIYYKWLGILEEEDTLPWRQFGVVAVILSFILLLITGFVSVWNHTLKIQVSKRTAELHDHQTQLIQADKMSSLGVLVSGVAHEINNPASLLLLNLPLLKDAWRDAQGILDHYAEQHPDLQIAGLDYARIKDELPLVIDDMSDGAHRIKRIVEDLKDFARHDTQKHDDLTHLNLVVQAAIRLVENSIRKTTDHFSVDYADDLPLIYANAQRIEQVIVNLLLNASQALSSREDGIHVETKYDEANQQVVLVVKDDGCGVDEEDLTRLTDPFFTTKRERGGTGLGLSVSASIVKTHDGILEFSSKNKMGTVATLMLPMAINEGNSE